MRPTQRPKRRGHRRSLRSDHCYGYRHGHDSRCAAHVFEPFFTTKDRRTRNRSGAEPGYGFVKQSGRHVRLHSEPGIGTSAKLYLPVVLAAAAPIWTPMAEPEVAADVPRGNPGETVLVVRREDVATTR